MCLTASGVIGKENTKTYMENKIQQLTEQLYQEGLSKGKAEAENIVAKAKEEAASIIAEAQKRAAQMAEEASDKAAETLRRSERELKAAAGQITAAVKSALSEMVLARSVGADVASAFGDDDFVRRLMTEAVKAFADGGCVTVGKGNEDKVAAYLQSAADKGVGEFTVTGGDGVGRGFRISPKGQGYYISFDEKDFDSLLRSYLKDGLNKVLFEEK